MGDVVKLHDDDEAMRVWDSGQQAGWHAALYIYGLRDCTIKNNGDQVQRFPIGRREAYIDLDPGEEAMIRTVEPTGWETWPVVPESAPPA